MRYAIFCLALVMVGGSLGIAQNAPTQAAAAPAVKLPAPQLSGGMSLNEALATRRSVRSFQATALTQAELSQLLWAAQGITDDKGHRTAPSAHAQYFLHIYVADRTGLFEYIPAGHSLQKLSEGDLREKLSSQPSVKEAPVVFLVAGEYDRAAKQVEKETAQRLVNLEAGHATENLLLEATALHLAGVPAAGFDPAQAAKVAGLPGGITPIYLVPVGHAK